MIRRAFAIAVLAGLLTPAPAFAGRANIEHVVGSRSADQRLTFCIEFAEPVTLDGETTVQIAIDADRDSTTGIDGLDYSLDWTQTAESMGDVTTELEGELLEYVLALTKPYALLTAVEGEAVESHPASLTFSHKDAVVTFSIAAVEIGAPEKFDFYAFIEQSGALDEAPSHVLFSAGAKPWTYPKGDLPAASDAYPTRVYTDATDLTLAEKGWLLPALLLGGVLALGALLGLGGWTVQRLRNRHGVPPTAFPRV